MREKKNAIRIMRIAILHYTPIPRASTFFRHESSILKIAYYIIWKCERTLSKLNPNFAPPPKKKLMVRPSAKAEWCQEEVNYFIAAHFLIIFLTCLLKMQSRRGRISNVSQTIYLLDFKYER